MSKPSALPKNWPKPTEADLADLPKRKVVVGGDQIFSFCNNSIKTSKYEIHTFLPKFLLEEFNPRLKIANCYFLLISGMQCIPAISNTGGYPTVLIPLTVVLVIAGVFKALEDIARHKADTKANSSIAEKYDHSTKSFVQIPWSQIAVGDYVRVVSRAVVPADLIILKVSEPDEELPKGICYVETKSLDGETNLKMRNLTPILLGKIKNDSFGILKGQVEMEHPNNLIDNFTGVLTLNDKDKTKAAIQPTNVILRGCVLRSTDWMVGLVVNTGHDVKIMQSTVSTIIKSSFLENSATKEVIGVIILLVFISITGSIGQAFFNYIVDVYSLWYLDWNLNPGEAGLIKFFYMLLLHASFIPVSLYVSMAMIRFGQSYFMQKDQDMYYEPIDCPMVVRTMTLNEELGQISHIFSDKTGTLTCNNMNFRKASINGVSYGQGITEIGRAAWKLQNKPIPAAVLEAEKLASQVEVPHVAFYDPEYERAVAIQLDDDDNNLNNSNINIINGNVNSGSSDSNSNLLSQQQDKNRKGVTLLDAKEFSVGTNSKIFGAYNGQAAAIKKNKSSNDIIGDGITATNSANNGNNNDIVTSTTMLVKQNIPPKEQKFKIREFYRFIATCHEVIAEKLEDGSTKLSAPNPDDEALVCAAKYFGFEFKDRRDKYCYIGDLERNQLLTIEVLYTIPFSSARKRMSVIIKDIDDQIKIITKGADSMMFTKVETSNENDIELNRITGDHINKYSAEGLRCLVVASKIIPFNEFADWSKRYDEANTNLNELDKRKAGLPNDINTLEDEIEQHLHVVGATAIEDRLQDGVPDCIEKLAQAGIKIWVLTGDKEETAINIAVACNLVYSTDYMRQVIINHSTAKTMEEAQKIFSDEIRAFDSEIHGKNMSMQIHEPPAISASDYTRVNNTDDINIRRLELMNLPKSMKPRALIIDGPSLINIMKDTTTKGLLLNFSRLCKAVVCCRVSPDQKREIVDMIKTGVPGVRTLAVGDGANDVAMIKAAHVGVGIKGEEGVQAVNASDYAIAQFRFLAPLILKHGRFNYVRMSNLICFMFYKNIYMSSCMFWFCFVNAFSSQKYFTEGAIQLFNLFYTSVPIILYGSYDMDVDRDDWKKYPELYIACIKGRNFNSRVFWYWIHNALVESILSSILPLYYLSNSSPIDGTQSTFWESGALCFSITVIIINLKLFTFQSKWTPTHILVMLLSIGSWICVAYIINSNYTIDFEFFHVWERLLRNGSYWLSLLVIVTLLCIKDVFLVMLDRESFTRPVHMIQDMNHEEAANKSSHINSISSYSGRDSTSGKEVELPVFIKQSQQ